jgi:hypothetical protein
MPLQAELLPAADIFLRYLCHFDAAKVDLSGPDPKHLREESGLCVRGRRAIGDCKGDNHAAALCLRPVRGVSFDKPDQGQAHRAAGNGLRAAA